MWARHYLLLKSRKLAHRRSFVLQNLVQKQECDQPMLPCISYRAATWACEQSPCVSFKPTLSWNRAKRKELVSFKHLSCEFRCFLILRRAQHPSYRECSPNRWQAFGFIASSTYPSDLGMLRWHGLWEKAFSCTADQRQEMREWVLFFHAKSWIFSNKPKPETFWSKIGKLVWSKNICLRLGFTPLLGTLARQASCSVCRRWGCVTFSQGALQQHFGMPLRKGI